MRGTKTSNNFKSLSIASPNGVPTGLIKDRADYIPFNKTTAMQVYFFIRVGKKYVRVNYRDILYLESTGNYVKLVTDAGSFLTALTIKELEKILPFEMFCRVNRGTIVSIDRVTSFDREHVILKNFSFSFSDKYRKMLEGKVKIISHSESARHGSILIGPEGLKGEIS
jgi:DNA-binding LytR/AlgR family response regulator